ncbi:MAG: hypothetical protein HY606_04885 [Planctomycetes bacterium]|nr:hypothetical protein [Planctomycetota bacterium]
MSEAKYLFDKNMEAIANIDAIYHYTEKQVTAFDITELLRAEYILIVSALDFYIHEAVKNCLVHQFNLGICDPDVKIGIPLATVGILLNSDSNDRTKILEQQIGQIISKDSYQAPRSIENALKMIGINKMWTAVGKYSGKKGSEVRATLALIIDRRNKIAHEADISPIGGLGEKTNIETTTVSECLDFVTKFVESVEKLINLKLEEGKATD